MLHVLWVESHLCSERTTLSSAQQCYPKLVLLFSFLLSSNFNEGRKNKHILYENYYPKKAIMVVYLFSIVAWQVTTILVT